MSEELVEQLKRREEFSNLPRRELLQLAELTARLRRVSLFGSLSIPDLALIARHGSIKRYEHGELVIREGDTDKVLYVILRGLVRVWTKKGGSEARLLNFHEAGDFFGELIFRSNGPRAANVDVVDDVELVAFEQEGYAEIVAHDQIANYLRTWGQERMRRSNQPFPGKHWDEILVVHAHKSWVALARVIFFPVMFILISMATWALLALNTHISSELLASVAIALDVGMGLWILWMWEDWRNDDFFVTSKRVIHVERILVPPFPVERHEAAIEQVQDIVTRRHGLWTWLANAQTLEIKTAGAGVIRFPYLHHAEQIREEVFHARELARTRRSVEERRHIREALFAELKMDRPIKAVTPLDSGETVEVTPRREGILRVVDYLTPRTRVTKPDQVIWRKHWFVLLRAVGPAILLFALAVALLAVGLIRPGILTEISRPWTMLPGIVLLLFSMVSYIWFYDGWCNDVYIVTDTRIVDIEGSPFHLRKETRREGTFDVIQNIDYNSPNWLARVLRIGDVTIDTASQRKAFSFYAVAHPEEVQQEIFKRLTAFRENRSQAEATRQYAEFAKWFEAYHTAVIEQKGASTWGENPG